MQDLCCSAKAFRSSTSPGSQTPGEPLAARHSMPPSVLPATNMKASASPSGNNHFGALSLRFRSGSVAPCPTLKPNVTASAPRTRYGRMANPYPAGLRSCYTLTAYKGSRLPPFPSGKCNIYYIFTARTIYLLYFTDIVSVFYPCPFTIYI